jgi:hypothetical protein
VIPNLRPRQRRTTRRHTPVSAAGAAIDFPPGRDSPLPHHCPKVFSQGYQIKGGSPKVDGSPQSGHFELKHVKMYGAFGSRTHPPIRNPSFLNRTRLGGIAPCLCHGLDSTISREAALRSFSTCLRHALTPTLEEGETLTKGKLHYKAKYD